MISRSSNITMITILVAILLTVSTSFACGNCDSSKSTQSEQIGSNVVNDAIKASPYSVIAFHSSTCGICKVQKPRLQSLLLKEQNSQMKNIFLDFDTEVDLRKNFNVAYPSTVIVFKNGAEVARVTGETDETRLQNLLNKSLL